MKTALAILRDSVNLAYGVAMFSEDGNEWDMGRKKKQEVKIGVGDVIVMERARKRRTELKRRTNMRRHRCGKVRRPCGRAARRNWLRQSRKRKRRWHWLRRI